MPMLSQHVHFVKGIDPIDDYTNGTVYTDVINLKNYSHATFVIYKGVGATGTATVTVLAGDDAANPPTNSTAIPFTYKRIANSADTEGAITAATTTDFATTAGSSEIYVIEVDAKELGDTGYGYVCLKFVEVTNSPVLAGVLVMLHGARFAQDIPATAIT